jgi:hypothetical protein
VAKVTRSRLRLWRAVLGQSSAGKGKGGEGTEVRSQEVRGQESGVGSRESVGQRLLSGNSKTPPADEPAGFVVWRPLAEWRYALTGSVCDS